MLLIDRLAPYFVISMSILSLAVGVYYNNVASIVLGGIFFALFGLAPIIFLVMDRITEMIETRRAYQQHQQHHPIGTHVYFPTIPRKRYGTVIAHSNSGADIISVTGGGHFMHPGGTARKHSTGRRPPNGQLETIMEKFHNTQQGRAVARGTSRFPDEATAKIGAMLFGLNEGKLVRRLNIKNEREREQREREAVATSANTPLLSNSNNGIKMLTLATSPKRSTDSKKRSKTSRRRK